MKHQVQCSVCHRVEEWSDQAAPVVLIAGGVRRVDGDPALARFRSALDAAEGVTGPIAGTCSACGQLLVAGAGVSVAPVAVTAALNGRQVTIEGAVAFDATGPLVLADVRKALTVARHVPWYRGLGADLARGWPLLAVVPVVLLWFAALSVMILFVVAFIQGPQSPVSALP